MTALVKAAAQVGSGVKPHRRAAAAYLYGCISALPPRVVNREIAALCDFLFPRSKDTVLIFIREANDAASQQHLH